MAGGQRRIDMRRKWLALAAVGVAGSALFAYAAGAQNESGWMRTRASGLMIRGIERDLGLTDDQRMQIKAILKAEQPTIETLAARVHEEQIQLQAEPAFDETAVRTFAKQHESTLEDVLVEREKVRSEIRGVLTPEQRDKADQMRSAFYSRFTSRLATLGEQL
jgi:P pilus assembly/Cpx signaling pathway, periplasmic inhibitor/zinc-resistance associated protein